jgi:hypothetical protein
MISKFRRVLYVVCSFWVIPRRLNFISRRFGTLSVPFHRQEGEQFTYIQLLAYEDGTDSVPKRRLIKFRRRGITQKKTYNKLKEYLPVALNVHTASSVGLAKFRLVPRCLQFSTNIHIIDQEYHQQIYTHVNMC